jgi:hypothetical protein
MIEWTRLLSLRASAPECDVMSLTEEEALACCVASCCEARMPFERRLQAPTLSTPYCIATSSAIAVRFSFLICVIHVFGVDHSCACRPGRDVAHSNL